MHHHVLHYVKLNPNQHNFTKSKFGNFSWLSDSCCLQSASSWYYFHFSNAFDLVSHNLLLHESSSFPSLAGFAVTNQQTISGSCFGYSIPTSSSKFRCAARLCPGHFLFNVFINDLCNSINHCKCLFFANLKIFRVIDSPHDCLLLQPVIITVSDRCVATHET
jgi:hypothetical protein